MVLLNYFCRGLYKITRKVTKPHFIASVINFTLILPSETKPLSAMIFKAFMTKMFLCPLDLNIFGEGYKYTKLPCYIFMVHAFLPKLDILLITF